METIEQREVRVAALEARRAGSRVAGGRVEDRALTTVSVPSVMLTSTASEVTVTPQSALDVADVWAVVRVLATSAASLPVHIYRRSESGRVRADDTLAARLLERPAPSVTQATFFADLMVSLQLHGEAFIAKYRNDDNAVFQLGLVAPERVTVEVRGGLPFYTVTTDLGEQRVVSTESIVHVRCMSDGLRGVSPIRRARESIGLSSALVTHGARFFANGARPSGVLSVPPGPNAEEQLGNLKDGWEARHRGVNNAGKTGFLVGDVSYVPVTMPMADAQWVEARNLSLADVCRVFGVPPWMVGAPTGDSLTYSTVAEQARAYVVFCLRPTLVVIEQALAADADLFPPEQRTYPLFALDALLRGDPKSRAEFYASGIEHSWLDPDEARELEDLPRRTRQELTANA